VSFLCSVKQRHVCSQGWAKQFSRSPFMKINKRTLWPESASELFWPSTASCRRS
jgi:hypothetical protein